MRPNRAPAHGRPERPRRDSNPRYRRERASFAPHAIKVFSAKVPAGIGLFAEPLSVPLGSFRFLSEEKVPLEVPPEAWALASAMPDESPTGAPSSAAMPSDAPPKRARSGFSTNSSACHERTSRLSIYSLPRGKSANRTPVGPNFRTSPIRGSPRSRLSRSVPGIPAHPLRRSSLCVACRECWLRKTTNLSCETAP
jgi:hypothetical protein